MKVWGVVFSALLLGLAGAFSQGLPSCAVMTFESAGGVTPDEGRILSDRFEIEFGRLGHYTLFPRANIGTVLDLQKYNLTCAGSECAVELGRLLTVQYTVFGSIGKLGSVYTINASLVNVETGQVEKQGSYDHRGEIEDFLVSGMAKAVRALLLGEHGETRPAAVAPPLPEEDLPAAAAVDGAVTNSLGMEFLPVPGLEILFGRHEVANEQYRRFKRHHDSGWYQGYSLNGDRQPAVRVSWNDARFFCEWLTRKERDEGRISRNQSYRLPTDYEWSVAVGLDEPPAGTPGSKDVQIKEVYPWGSQWPPPKGAGNFSDEAAGQTFSGWTIVPGYNDGFPTTAPVGSFAPNRFGLYDMSGNVWEWCEDKYKPSENWRALRGGAWDNSTPKSLLSSSRNNYLPANTGVDSGFRVVLGATPLRGIDKPVFF